MIIMEIYLIIDDYRVRYLSKIKIELIKLIIFGFMIYENNVLNFLLNIDKK